MQGKLKTTIAWIQIVLGILLIISTIVTYPLFFDELDKTNREMGEALHEVSNYMQVNENADNQTQLLILNDQFSMTQGFLIAIMILLASEIIIAVLAVMMLLQGLANLKK
jgi:hypothetical protein